MSLSVLPEDFGLLTNLTSLELRENLIKVGEHNEDQGFHFSLTASL